MEYPAFIQEMAAESSRRKLLIGVWSGYFVATAFLALVIGLGVALHLLENEREAVRKVRAANERYRGRQFAARAGELASGSPALSLLPGIEAAHLLRDAEGRWLSILFDVDAETWAVDEGACDGCGAVWWQGQEIGEACIDASVLLDWEERPW